MIKKVVFDGITGNIGMKRPREHIIIISTKLVFELKCCFFYISLMGRYQVTLHNQVGINYAVFIYNYT